MPYDDSNVDDESAAAPDMWEVTGDKDVLGHAPGDVFEATIPDAQAQRLQDRGALRKVTDDDEGSTDDVPSTDPPVSTESTDPPTMGDNTGNYAGEGETF